MDNYDTDERGYYDRSEYKRTGRKFRPLAFDNGEMIIDSPRAGELRAWWRERRRETR